MDKSLFPTNKRYTIPFNYLNKLVMCDNEFRNLLLGDEKPGCIHSYLETHHQEFKDSLTNLGVDYQNLPYRRSFQKRVREFKKYMILAVPSVPSPPVPSRANDDEDDVPHLDGTKSGAFTRILNDNPAALDDLNEEGLFCQLALHDRSSSPRKTNTMVKATRTFPKNMSYIDHFSRLDWLAVHDGKFKELLQKTKAAKVHNYLKIHDQIFSTSLIALQVNYQNKLYQTAFQKKVNLLKSQLNDDDDDDDDDEDNVPRLDGTKGGVLTRILKNNPTFLDDLNEEGHVAVQKSLHGAIEDERRMREEFLAKDIQMRKEFLAKDIQMRKDYFKGDNQTRMAAKETRADLLVFLAKSPHHNKKRSRSRCFSRQSDDDDDMMDCSTDKLARPPPRSVTPCQSTQQLAAPFNGQFPTELPKFDFGK